ncbi:MAG: GIY-YIG nuclease family protein [Halanaerobiales bacterium]
MLKIFLSKIIKLNDPTKYKFHAARWNEEDQPLDVFVRDKEEWFNWNRWRGSKNEFTREYIFSLIDFYHEANTWLFGGIYKVLERRKKPNDFSYEIEEVMEYKPYVGRLKIKLDKPSRGRSFYLEKYYSKMIVSEILRAPYSGEYFPGFDNICYNFHELESIFILEKPSWKAALENIKGVYLIVDKLNGRKYIGSAYGEYGIWSRWKCYLNTGHGWNDELTRLINKEGLEYAKNNFKITLLEHMPKKTQDDYIIAREIFWKEALLARGEFGYNKN